MQGGSVSPNTYMNIHIDCGTEIVVEAIPNAGYEFQG